jgi:hypothetical protein
VAVGYVFGARAPDVVRRQTSFARRQLLVSALVRPVLAGVAASDS